MTKNLLNPTITIMFPPFSQEQSCKILSDLFQMLRCGSSKIIQLSRPSQERKDQGLMLGCLVCQKEDGTIVNLVTNSGIAKAVSSLPENLIYVPPVVSSAEIEKALEENDREIHILTEELNTLRHKNPENPLIKEKSQLLTKLCSVSLEKVHSLYNFHCADHKIRTIKEICLDYNKGKLPPTGTGDCCAPKLLHYAYSNNLIPLSMAEAFYDEKDSSRSPQLLPPCDSRCGILLPAMLELRILYRDEYIVVVNKQSGVLSVPGCGPEKQDCIVNRVRRLFPSCIEQPAVHRLDMETSGILVLALTKEAHKELNRQFENREVHKEYEALLDGVLAQKGIAKEGTMELFFRLDVDNRPHQIWDRENGKSAITQWEILNVERYHAPDGSTRNATRVRFIPHTGRTHQLRLASADSHGFGVPIIGDTLYGRCEARERLTLHAKKIHFRHPVTGAEMDFESEPEF